MACETRKTKGTKTDWQTDNNLWKKFIQRLFITTDDLGQIYC